MEAQLSVVVGAPALISQLPAGDVLLIDASSTRLEALAARNDPTRSLVCETAMLTEEPGGMVLWHRYDDARFDGVVPPEHWHDDYPNLHVLGHDHAVGQRLESLLDRWAADGRRPTAFQLLIRQGNPLAAVAGMGGWLPHLQRLELAGPRASELWREPMGVWLEARGFRPSSQPGTWERDLLETYRLERDALAVRVKHYEACFDQMAAELDQLLRRPQDQPG